MDVLIGVLSALIAAVVSLVVAYLSFQANRHEMRTEREKLERELQRSMTARLYDLRLEVYPEAIAITDGLRRSRLRALGDQVSAEYLANVLAKLDDWHSSRAFLLLSYNAVQTLYELRDRLREAPGLDGGRYSDEQKHGLQKAKNKFRSALRADIQLLYEEEASRLKDD